MSFVPVSEIRETRYLIANGDRIVTRDKALEIIDHVIREALKYHSYVKRIDELEERIAYLERRAQW